MNEKDNITIQSAGGVCNIENDSHLHTNLPRVANDSHLQTMLTSVENDSHLQQWCCRIATLLLRCHCVWNTTMLQMCNTMVLQNCHTVADRLLLQDCIGVAKL